MVFLKRMSILVVLYLANCFFPFVVNSSLASLDEGTYFIYIILSGPGSTLLVLILYQLFKRKISFIKNPVALSRYLFIQSVCSFLIHPIALVMATLATDSANNSTDFWIYFLRGYFFIWVIPNLILFSSWYGFAKSDEEEIIKRAS